EREDEERKKARRPQPWYIEDKKVESLSLSADEQFVAVELVEESKDQHVTQIPDYVTFTGFTEEKKSRIKVGDVPKRYSLQVLNLETSRAIEVTHSDKAASSAEKEEKDSEKEGKDSKAKKSAPDVFSPVWSRTGHGLLAAARSTDNKDQWLLSVNVESGLAQVVNHEHDDAWVLNDDDAPS